MATFYGKMSNQPYRLNSFRLEGLENLKLGYRLIGLSGLIEDDEDYDKKIGQLAIQISGKVKLPVEPIRVSNETHLAVIGLSERLHALSIDNKYSLTPDDVFTRFESGFQPLELNAGIDRTHTRLGRRALNWAIDNALKSPDTGWWKYNMRFVSRYPFDSRTSWKIHVHPAFYFGFVAGANGEFELSLTPSVCYIEARSAYEKYGRNIPTSIKGKRFLFRNGTEFYPITAVGVGKAASQEMMEDPSTHELISIQQRMKDRWGNRGIPEIDGLDGSALTIAYKTKGQKSRRAHAQLVYELVGVSGSDDGHHTPHNEAIMNPDKRGYETEKIIGQLSSYLKLFGVSLNPSRQMRKLNWEVRCFDPPKIRIANDEVLTTNLETMGKDRFDALRHHGPNNPTDFLPEQLFISGNSLPDEVRLDFKNQFVEVIKDLYGKCPGFHNVNVDDRFADTMRKKFNSIVNAIGSRQGYGLLVLPKERRDGQEKKLHDYLKRRLWNQVQTQCVSAESILRFYRRERDAFNEDRWALCERTRSRYSSFLRFLALGYLEVNRKWLWKLAEGSLKNEVHVGIDVYQDLAVFTFIYGDGDLITFEPVQTRRGEKLSSSLIRETLLNNLREDLKQLGICPKSIVFHRDGKVFRSEAKGICETLEILKEEKLLASDLRFAIVEIHKTSSSKPRVYKRVNSKFDNPEMGLFVRLCNLEGVLATTGAPLLRRGTAQPLSIEIFKGNIDIDDIAHDIYALSHLAFASPGSAMSLPFTIELADRILRESSPGEKISWWDDEEGNDAISVDYVKELQTPMSTGVGI